MRSSALLVFNKSPSNWHFYQFLVIVFSHIDGVSLSGPSQKLLKPWKGKSPLACKPFHQSSAFPFDVLCDYSPYSSASFLSLRYPLLLSRICKATPRRNTDREKLKVAQRKIEEQLNKINAVSNLQ